MTLSSASISRVVRRLLPAVAGVALMAIGFAGQPGRSWAATVASTPIYREIGDWILACDNTRSCVAKFMPDDSAPDASATTGETGYITFTRDGGPDGKANLSLSAETAFDVDKARLDGHPIGVHGWGRTSEPTERTLDGKAALDFMRIIRNGTVLSFSATAKTPQATLKGFSAVLLAMDEAQGRLGNASALVRTGSAPASATPPAPAPPIVHAAVLSPPLKDAEALIMAVRRTQARTLKAHDCDSQRRDEDAAEPLNAEEAIVVVECSDGAYQSSNLVFRTPRAEPSRAKLLALPRAPTSAPEDSKTAGEYTEASYDPKTATLAESAKGRGVADCGLSTQWTYDGHNFQVSDASRQERCGGGEPSWPTLYRSRVVPAR